MSGPTDEERILWELEKQREVLEGIKTAIENLQPTEEPGPISDHMGAIETLQTHMGGNGVDTTLVSMEDRGDVVYFKEIWEEMNDDEVQAFRDYTMNQDHVKVSQWVERNGNSYPDGFEVDKEELDGLV